MNPTLSIVIASYNSAKWLPSTLDSIQIANSKAGWVLEVVVVDDGSTDDTQDVLSKYAQNSTLEIRNIVTSNQGRFLARWTGVQEARSENILIFDSRILMGKDSLNHLLGITSKVPKSAWNAHIDADKSSPLVGLFWDAPTRIFWKEYLQFPKLMEITMANFDRVPKGTTCFFVKKDVFIEACLHAWPSENAHLTSDDTKLIRHIVSKIPVFIDPNFKATYRPRTSFIGFLRHSFVRGTLFVDSYAGTALSRNWILLAMAFIPIATLLCSVFTAIGAYAFWPVFIVALFGIIICLIAFIAFLAKIYGASNKSLISFLLYSFPFAAVFWAGILRGVFVHRKNFSKSSTE